MKKVKNMNSDFWLQKVDFWRSIACELMEFIEYDLDLTPRQETEYQNIINKYVEGDE